MAAVAEPIAWETALPQARELPREEKSVLLDFSAAPE